MNAAARAEGDIDNQYDQGAQTQKSCHRGKGVKRGPITGVRFFRPGNKSGQSTEEKAAGDQGQDDRPYHSGRGLSQDHRLDLAEIPAAIPFGAKQGGDL